jgi:hypothetical protein
MKPETKLNKLIARGKNQHARLQMISIRINTHTVTPSGRRIVRTWIHDQMKGLMKTQNKIKQLKAG